MGAIKNYLLSIQERVSEHSFGQDAVQHAIFTGALKLTYNLESDVKAACESYDNICIAYTDFVHNGPRPVELEVFRDDPGAFAEPIVLGISHSSHTAVVPAAPVQRRPVAARQEDAVVR